MQDDPADFSVRPGYGCVELPARAIAMENCDGRLMVTLEDGRVIDMTDWFSNDAPKN